MSSVVFDRQEELSVITVENAFATAKITPYGAQVLSFVPKNAKGVDLLWLSPSAVFNGRQAVRGGIPICWPWFGKHATKSPLPAHGFVRNLLWQLDRVKTLDCGATELIFSIESCESTLEMWPYEFHLALVVTVAEALSLRLITTNLSQQEMHFTEALHSYFNVKNVSNVSVSGLEGSTEIDALNKMARNVQAGSLSLSPPIDSIFLNHSDRAIIEDQRLSRHIFIHKQSSSSTVVWNPGSEIVKGFSDIPEASWPDFLCVESGNVFENTVTLASGERHELLLTLSSALF